MSYGKRNTSNRRSKSKGPCKSNSTNDVMDDLMAQLQRQRERQRLDEAAASSTDGVAYGCNPISLGKFRYDPILKRYLPKSTFKSNGNNDVCIQRMQRASIAPKAESKCSSMEKSSSCFAAVDTRGIRRLVFRGCCLRQTCVDSGSASAVTNERKNKSKKRKSRRKNLDHIDNEDKFKHNNLETINDCNVEGSQLYNKIACSDMSIVLLATSLSYCSSTRRNNVATILGQISTARELEVVPSLVTKDMLFERNKIGCLVASGENGHNRNLGQMKQPEVDCSHESQEDTINHSRKTIEIPSIWYSMLKPIHHDLSDPEERWYYNSRQKVPIDCYCKTYLRPTAPTFDILCGSGMSLPRVVTIMENIYVHHRAPVSIPAQGLEAYRLERGSSQDNCAAIFVPGKVYGVRLAQHEAENFYIGCVTYYAPSDESGFTLHRCFDDNMYTTDQYKVVDGGVDDFCFGGANLSTVVFPHVTESRAAVTFLNLETQRVHKQQSSNWSDSAPLCVQYRTHSNDNCDQLLLGHRDGTLSMIDIRSSDTQFATSCADDFGSVSSILQLKNNEHLIVAKGSFGSCRVFDVRRMNNNNKRDLSRHQQASVFKLLPPNDVHYTKSTNCTGVAIDPLENVVIAPYATETNQVMASLWAVDSGKLLRTVKLEDACTLDNHCPLFCELNSTSTCGFRMSSTNELTPIITGGRWGVWYKSRSASSPLIPGTGSIHHISF